MTAITSSTHPEKTASDAGSAAFHMRSTAFGARSAALIESSFVPTTTTPEAVTQDDPNTGSTSIACQPRAQRNQRQPSRGGSIRPIPSPPVVQSIQGRNTVNYLFSALFKPGSLDRSVVRPQSCHCTGERCTLARDPGSLGRP